MKEKNRCRSMNTAWAIFLDLDQTLVLTSSLEHLRKQRQWQQVYQSFHLTALPTGTRQFLLQASQLAPLGIITRTPRPYAERLVAYHHLNLPVVIDFHESRPRHKPYPDPIIKAATKWDIALSHCFYVGDAPDDILAATRAKALPIGLTWDGSLSSQPECTFALALCTNWEEVLTAIEQTMKTQGVTHEKL